MSMSKPRLAMLSDVRGWAFCVQAHDLELFLAERLEVTHMYVAEWVAGAPVPNLLEYDTVYCPYHRWNIDRYLPWDRTLGSLRAQWLFPERKRQPMAEEFAVVNRFRAFNVVNRTNFAEYEHGCSRLHYLTNPVNVRRFPVPTPRRNEVIASWNGNAGHTNASGEDVKGFYSIVHPACKKAGVPLVFAEYSTCRKEPHEMPAFYLQGNLGLSASLYEGASSSVMEAMAAGLAMIVTDCGNHREMQEMQIKRYGETGMRIVERSIDALAAELAVLKNDPDLVYEMGQINRQSVIDDWSWDVWADPFFRFLTIPLEHA